MTEWLIKSSEAIMHLFDDEMVQMYALCGAALLVLGYLLYLVLSGGALAVMDNGDGTETQYFIGGKRMVKKEEEEEE